MCPVPAARARMAKLVADVGKAGSERSPHAKFEYTGAEFEPLAGKFLQLNWRMISKPGGATVKPDDFYRLYALQQQVGAEQIISKARLWN